MQLPLASACMGLHVGKSVASRMAFLRQQGSYWHATAKRMSVLSERQVELRSATAVQGDNVHQGWPRVSCFSYSNACESMGTMLYPRKPACCMPISPSMCTKICFPTAHAHVDVNAEQVPLVKRRHPVLLRGS